jgi:hypothetical protein
MLVPTTDLVTVKVGATTCGVLFEGLLVPACELYAGQTNRRHFIDRV